MKKILQNKKTIALIATVFTLILLGIVGYYLYGANKISSNDVVASTQEIRPGSGTSSEAPVDNKDGQPSTTIPNDTKQEQGGITISAPVAGTSIEPGTTRVSGTVTTSVGGDLYYMIKGATSGTLIDTKVEIIPAGANLQQYSFTINLDRLPKGSDSAVLEVYLMSGTDRLGYADIGIKI